MIQIYPILSCGIAGNVQDWEMEQCLQHQLIPTVASSSAVGGMALALAESKNMTNGYTNTKTKPKLDENPPEGAVHIKIDSGMCRNGCQPGDVPGLVKVHNY